MKNIKELSSELRSLNPKEIHNWPMTINVLIGVVLMIVLIAAGTFLDLMDKYDDLTTAQGKEEKLKTDYLDKKKQAINLDLYKKQLDDVTIASNNLLKQLPNKSEMDRLLIDINQAALSRGLQIELFKPNQEKMSEFYAELPISIKVNGTYQAIGQFATDVSQLSRVVLLKEMDLNKKDKDSPVISMDVTAKTFRYLDQDELNKQREEKAKAKRDKAKAAAAATSDK